MKIDELLTITLQQEHTRLVNETSKSVELRPDYVAYDEWLRNQEVCKRIQYYKQMNGNIPEQTLKTWRKDKRQ